MQILLQFPMTSLSTPMRTSNLQWGHNKCDEIAKCLLTWLTISVATQTQSTIPRCTSSTGQEWVDLMHFTASSELYVVLFSCR